MVLKKQNNMKVKNNVKSDILKVKDVKSSNINLNKSKLTQIKAESIKSNNLKASNVKTSEKNFSELKSKNLIKTKVQSKVNLGKKDNSKILTTKINAKTLKKTRSNKIKSSTKNKKIIKTNRSKSKLKRAKINKILNFKKEFYFNQVFLKFLLKKGDINKAKKIFKNTFNILFRDTGLGSYSILSQIYLKLHINFEIRRIKVRRNSHIVPVPLNAKRRYYLICKWIFDSVNANKSYQEFSIKLAAELLKILKDQNCESISKKKMVQSTAISNRSNTHYRW